MSVAAVFPLPVEAGLLGAVVGTVLALTGAGGGVMAVPLLVLVLHWPLGEAAPTALLAVGFAAALGAVNGMQTGQVRWRAALLMGGAGMLGAPVGIAMSRVLPSAPLLWGFATLMLWLGWRQWPRPHAVEAPHHEAKPACIVNPHNGRLHWTSRCARAVAGTGLLSGTLSGLIGVGGGFVIVPALKRHTNLALRQVQLTSLAVIALVAISGVASAALHGQLPWHEALPFTGGAMAAMLLGRQLADKMPPVWSHRFFSASCILVATLLLTRTL